MKISKKEQKKKKKPAGGSSIYGIKLFLFVEDFVTPK